MPVRGLPRSSLLFAVLSASLASASFAAAASRRGGRPPLGAQLRAAGGPDPGGDRPPRGRAHARGARPAAGGRGAPAARPAGEIGEGRGRRRAGLVPARRAAAGGGPGRGPRPRPRDRVPARERARRTGAGAAHPPVRRPLAPADVLVGRALPRVPVGPRARPLRRMGALGPGAGAAPATRPRPRGPPGDRGPRAPRLLRDGGALGALVRPAATAVPPDGRILARADDRGARAHEARLRLPSQPARRRDLHARPDVRDGAEPLAHDRERAACGPERVGARRLLVRGWRRASIP